MRLALAYAAIVLIWSTTPLAIKWSTESLSFIAGLASRVVLSALVCTLLVLWRRRGIPLDRRAVASYGAGVLGIYGAMSCVYFSAQYIPSGLISVMFGLAPVLSGIFAELLLKERAFTPAKLVALAIALAGLSLIFRGEMAINADAWPGLIAILAGTALFALSGVLVKCTSAHLDPLSHTTATLLFSLPLFFITWLAFDGQVPEQVSSKSLAAVLYLALIGSVVGFLLYFWVLQRMAASKLALVTLMTPGLALILGATLEGETIASSTWTGTALVLAGLALHLVPERFLPTCAAAGKARSPAGPKSASDQTVIG